MCLSCPNNGFCALHILIRSWRHSLPSSMLSLVKPALILGGYIKSQCHISFVRSLSLNTAWGRIKLLHAGFTLSIFVQWLVKGNSCTRHNLPLWEEKSQNTKIVRRAYRLMSHARTLLPKPSGWHISSWSSNLSNLHSEKCVSTLTLAYFNLIQAAGCDFECLVKTETSILT